MARYRKIDTRIHGDAKFRALSAPQPCGRYLWFYLLTCPQHTNIPGVIVAGPAGLAEALRWPMKGFREAFAEAFQQGMVKADENAFLMWLPKATAYNRPESPNVVRGWGKTWPEVPECPLKGEIYQHLKGYTEGLGEGYSKAFLEGFPKDFGESGTGTGTGYIDNPPIGPPSTKQPAKRKARPSRKAPKSFTVTDDMRAWAADKTPGVDIDAETETFRDHEFRDPKRDWPAAWRNWMKRAQQWSKTNGTGKAKLSAVERVAAANPIDPSSPYYDGS